LARHEKFRGTNFNKNGRFLLKQDEFNSNSCYRQIKTTVEICISADIQKVILVYWSVSSPYSTDQRQTNRRIRYHDTNVVGFPTHNMVVKSSINSRPRSGDDQSLRWMINSSTPLSSGRVG